MARHNKNISQKPKNGKKSLMLLIKSLKPYRWAVVVALLFAVIGTVIALILPNLLKYLFQHLDFLSIYKK